MIEISVPGYRTFRFRHLVLDFNGTLALDGELLDGVRERLIELSASLELHVLTADTHGHAASRLEGVPCRVEVVPADNQSEAKRDYVTRLGPEAAVCVGNGRNDRLMLQEAALGIAVLQEEGAAVETMNAADVVVPDIQAAFSLLEHPLRLVATLRS
jgi:soluble P-type ATPase